MGHECEEFLWALPSVQLCFSVAHCSPLLSPLLFLIASSTPAKLCAIFYSRHISRDPRPFYLFGRRCDRSRQARNDDSLLEATAVMITLHALCGSVLHCSRLPNLHWHRSSVWELLFVCLFFSIDCMRVRVCVYVQVTLSSFGSCTWTRKLSLLAPTALPLLASTTCFRCVRVLQFVLVWRCTHTLWIVS